MRHVAGHKEDIKPHQKFVVVLRFEMTTNQADRHPLCVMSQMTAVWYTD
jgi:hypothetical protein